MSRLGACNKGFGARPEGSPCDGSLSQGDEAGMTSRTSRSARDRSTCCRGAT